MKQLLLAISILALAAYPRPSRADDDSACAAPTSYDDASSDDANDCKSLTDTIAALKGFKQGDFPAACTDKYNSAVTVNKDALTACTAYNTALQKYVGDAKDFNVKASGMSCTDLQSAFDTLKAEGDTVDKANDDADKQGALADAASKDFEACVKSNSSGAAPICKDNQSLFTFDGISQCVADCPDSATMNDTTGKCEPDCDGDNQEQFSDPNTGKVSCVPICKGDLVRDTLSGQCVDDSDVPPGTGNPGDSCYIGQKIGADGKPVAPRKAPTKQVKVVKPSKKMAAKTAKPAKPRAVKPPKVGEIVKVNGKLRCVPACKGDTTRNDKGKCVKGKPAPREKAPPKTRGAPKPPKGGAATAGATDCKGKQVKVNGKCVAKKNCKAGVQIYDEATNTCHEDQNAPCPGQKVKVNGKCVVKVRCNSKKKPNYDPATNTCH